MNVSDETRIVAEFVFRNGREGLAATTSMSQHIQACIEFRGGYTLY